MTVHIKVLIIAFKMKIENNAFKRYLLLFATGHLKMNPLFQGRQNQMLYASFEN